MNISFLNVLNSRQVSFSAKTESQPRSSNVVQDTFLKKQEFTEIEKEFNDVLVQYNRISQNAASQRQLLKIYYSTQDKYDYQMLLKEKKRLAGQLKRIAQKAGIDKTTMEINVLGKKEYNRYLSKVLGAKTILQLENLQNFIAGSIFFVDVKAALLKVISKQKEILRKIC